MSISATRLSLLALLCATPALLGQPPLAGEFAPDFELKVKGEDRTLKLSDYRGVKPVALVFGSFT